MKAEEVAAALQGLGRVSVREGVVRVEVEVSRLREAAERIASMGFDHVASLTVVDRLKEGRFELIYVAESYDNPGVLVELVTRVPRGEPRVPSLLDVWPSLVWQERENWEMFGIEFEGHEGLHRHLLLPPDWPDNVHPLRKDFVVKEEPIMAPPELQKKAEELAKARMAQGGQGKQ